MRIESVFHLAVARTSELMFAMVWTEETATQQPERLPDAN